MDVTTARLRIRDFVEDDLASIIAWRTDPDVVRYMELTGPDDPEEHARYFLAESIEYNGHVPRESHNCAIVLRETCESIGWIGIGTAAQEKRSVGDLDFGYALERAHWGQGFAPEALRAVLELGFTEMGAHAIFGECHTPNTRSANVMLKAGMTHVGRSPWDDKSDLFTIRRLWPSA